MLGRWEDTLEKKLEASLERSYLLSSFIKRKKIDAGISLSSVELPRVIFGLYKPLFIFNDIPTLDGKPLVQSRLSLPLATIVFAPFCIPKSEYRRCGFTGPIVHFQCLDPFVWLEELKIKTRKQLESFKELDRKCSRMGNLHELGRGKCVFLRFSELKASYLEKSKDLVFPIALELEKKYSNILFLYKERYNAPIPPLENVERISGADIQSYIANSDLFIGGGGCLDKNASLLTPSGIKTIENVREGNKVLGYNFKTGASDFTSVRNIYSPVFSTRMHLIQIKDKDIYCSDEHPFYTSEGWIRARYLYEGAEILTSDLSSIQRKDFDASESEELRVGLFSGTDRWRRKFLYPDRYLLEKRISIDALFRNFELRPRNIQLAQSEVWISEKKKSYQEAFQNCLRYPCDRDQIKRNSRWGSTLSKDKKKAGRIDERNLSYSREEDEVRTQRRGKENLWKKRSRDILESQSFKLRFREIETIHREEKRKVALRDITTGLGNYFADGALVHNTMNVEAGYYGVPTLYCRPRMATYERWMIRQGLGYRIKTVKEGVDRASRVLKLGLSFHSLASQVFSKQYFPLKEICDRIEDSI